VYNITQCGGLHGHIRVGPDGTLYLPNASCGDNQQGLAISEDNGVNWRVSLIPGSSAGNSDPYVDVAADNTVYYGWSDGTGHAFATVSKDKGRNWSAPVDVGAPVNVENSVFPTMVVGDPDRAAMAFIGTQTTGDYQAPNFQGDWFMYAALTYDGGKTWTTYNTTPNDPVQRGCIWNGGGSNPCRNLLDFFGIAMDKQGRVLIGYADGCIDDPLNASNRCVSNPAADVRDGIKTKLATIGRQSGGLPLFAANDGLFAVAPGAPVLSGIAGNKVSKLNWTVPSNGGAAISKYKIYRATNPTQFTLLTSVGGSVTNFDDAAVVNDTTYYYRVSAVNPKGEGPSSNTLELTPKFAAAPSAPQRLNATGKQGGVLVMWSTPKSQGTSPITGYKLYRGSSATNLTLYKSFGNINRFADEGLTPDSTYYYQVTAINAVGESPRSNTASAKVK
jgi:hypothetical protein